MADSTSRWAEALRELSGRLGEIPAEEGYPAYLATRLAGFYDRAGYVKNLNGTEGSITIVGAVSPQGADFSEPVTRHTKRFARTYWALDRRLAYGRHFPAIDWNQSYSGYLEDLHEWYSVNVSPQFLHNRGRVLAILQEESTLLEIVKLVGADALADIHRLTLAVARVIRLGFAQQNAYHSADAYVSLDKQNAAMEVLLYLSDACHRMLKEGTGMETIEQSGIFAQAVTKKHELLKDAIDGIHRLA
jgi:V/A-type H+-transporting ATPase subunit A